MERRFALTPFAAARSARNLIARALGSTLALLLLLMGAPTAGAAPSASPPPSFFESLGRVRPSSVSSTPHPAVVRVVAAEHQAQSQGSGTLVDVSGDCGLIVTNWHVIRDATGEIVVYFSGGFHSQARVLKVDKDWDLAALVIWNPQVEPVRIAAAAPRRGEPLSIAGFGSGRYRATTGRCTQFVAPGPHMPYEMIEVSTEARQGDSGGPIFNEQGELAGVLFGASSGSTSGSHALRVRNFLASVAPHLDSRQDPRSSPHVLAATVEGGANAATQLAAPPSNPLGRPEFNVGTAATPAPPSLGHDSLQAAPPLLPGRVAQTLPNESLTWPISQSSSPPIADTARELVPRGASGDFRLSEPTAATSDWRSYFGNTPFEQGKSVLAILGVLAVLLKLFRPAG